MTKITWALVQSSDSQTSAQSYRSKYLELEPGELFFLQLPCENLNTNLLSTSKTGHKLIIYMFSNPNLVSETTISQFISSVMRKTEVATFLPTFCPPNQINLNMDLFLIGYKL